MNTKDFQKQNANVPYNSAGGFSGKVVPPSAPTPPAAPVTPSRPTPPMKSGSSQPEGMNKKMLWWGILLIAVVVAGFFLFGRSASTPDSVDTDDVTDTTDDSADTADTTDDDAVTISQGITGIVVSRSADLSAHAKVMAGATVLEEFDVTLESYSDVTPVLTYIVDKYGKDDSTITYMSMLDVMTFVDVSRPAGQ
ncbi:MAG: hypothetical protein AAB458_02885 [Patescibacteria group bacterium]